MSSTSPSALACIITLPMAVASVGPVTTGMPSADAVNSLSMALFAPPPTMCSVRIALPRAFSSFSTVQRYLSASDSYTARAVWPTVSGTGCPVLRQ